MWRSGDALRADLMGSSRSFHLVSSKAKSGRRRKISGVDLELAGRDAKCRDGAGPRSGQRAMSSICAGRRPRTRIITLQSPWAGFERRSFYFHLPCCAIIFLRTYSCNCGYPANFSGLAPRQGPLRLAGCSQLLAAPFPGADALMLVGGTLITQRTGFGRDRADCIRHEIDSIKTYFDSLRFAHSFAALFAVPSTFCSFHLVCARFSFDSTTSLNFFIAASTSPENE